MDATCNVQDSIHVFHLVHNMCPGFWVHINPCRGIFLCTKSLENNSRLLLISKIICPTNNIYKIRFIFSKNFKIYA